MAVRKVLIPTILLISVSGMAEVAWGQGGVRSTSLSASPGYWTTERLHSARPLPLPRVADLAPDSRRAGLRYGTGGLDFTSSRLVPADARTVYPYSAVGKLFFSQGADDFICSAAVISARVVLTAAHCVFDEVADEFFSDFALAPAYHMGDSPFGVWTANAAFVSQVWADGQGVPNPEDWAFLVMDDQESRKIGDMVGWLGFKRKRTADNHLTLLGYPGNHDGGGWMHVVGSGDWFDFGDGTVAYGSDMEGGSSGGPWVQNFGVKAKGQKGGKNPQQNRVVGITSFGFDDKKILAQGTSAVTSSFKTLFNEVCASASGNCRNKGKPNS